MKSVRATGRGRVAWGMVLSLWGVSCGSSAPRETHVGQDTDMDEAEASDSGAGSSATDASAEQRADAGTKPATDCSSFAPVAADMAFLATGWMGDAPTSVMFVDCTGARATASALGNCHEVTYAPLASTGAMGWAGINWQNPQGYWDDPPEPFVGYPMPCGATQISFYAKGAKGGEVVDFWGGNKAYQAKLDKVMLTAEWKQYSMRFNGSPDGNVTIGFGFALGADAAGGPGGQALFYLDDIRWE